MESTLPDWSEIQALCTSNQLPVDASELHGALCGLIAAGADIKQQWLSQVIIDAEVPAIKEGSEFDVLRKVTLQQFEDRSFDFQLLLPDDSQSLEQRSGALFDWCRGLLGAFGLVEGNHSKLSDESTEALHDIAKLASSPAQDVGDEDDEAALIEIEEYIRMSVLLIHSDCVLGPRHRNRLN